MAFDDKTKALLRRFYVFEQLSLDHAAEKADVSFNTARRWKKQALENGDNWDKAREAHIMAGGEMEDISKGLLTGFIVQYRATMDEIKQNPELTAVEKVKLLTALADSFTKMTAASKRLLPEISELAIAMKTVELFGSHIQQHKPQLLGDFVELLDSFGETLDRTFRDK